MKEIRLHEPRDPRKLITGDHKILKIIFFKVQHQDERSFYLLGL